jgi:hypothetical protein
MSTLTTCTYCGKTYSSTSNYTKHLRTFAAKHDKRHPAQGSPEFKKLEKEFNMWKLAEKTQEVKQEMRGERNARYYDKKKEVNQARVQQEIRKALYNSKLKNSD